jgi:hypothetical protein
MKLRFTAESGRPDSNRQRLAWKASALPLSYTRGGGGTHVTARICCPTLPTRHARCKMGEPSSETTGVCHIPRARVVEADCGSAEAGRGDGAPPGARVSAIPGVLAEAGKRDGALPDAADEDVGRYVPPVSTRRRWNGGRPRGRGAAGVGRRPFAEASRSESKPRAMFVGPNSLWPAREAEVDKTERRVSDGWPAAKNVPEPRHSESATPPEFSTGRGTCFQFTRQPVESQPVLVAHECHGLEHARNAPRSRIAGKTLGRGSD